VNLKKILIILFFNIFIFDILISNSIDKKIGQLLIVGFRGFNANKNSRIVKDIKEYGLGGVILFDYDVVLKEYRRNIKNKNQLKNLINNLQSFSDIPLFVAVDLEGGKVNRLKRRYGFIKIPSQKEVGDNKSKDYALKIVRSIIKNLKSVGFNMNFSPVIDVNINANNPIIGKLGRSFSRDWRRVYEIAKIYLKEYKKNKIIGVVKHFPGHGSSHKDSHLGVVDVTNFWKNEELLPYKLLIKDKLVDFVMISHIYNKNFDKKYPSSLSKNVITGLLKNKLGFNGIILSDDLNMKAITNSYSLKDAIELSIKAGTDMLIFGNNLVYDKNIVANVIKIIKELIKDGKITKERIEYSYKKIINFKKGFFKY